MNIVLIIRRKWEYSTEAEEVVCVFPFEDIGEDHEVLGAVIRDLGYINSETTDASVEYYTRVVPLTRLSSEDRPVWFIADNTPEEV